MLDTILCACVTVRITIIHTYHIRGALFSDTECTGGLYYCTTVKTVCINYSIKRVRRFFFFVLQPESLWEVAEHIFGLQNKSAIFCSFFRLVISHNCGEDRKVGTGAAPSIPGGDLDPFSPVCASKRNLMVSGPSRVSSCCDLMARVCMCVCV